MQIICKYKINTLYLYYQSESQTNSLVKHTDMLDILLQFTFKVFLVVLLSSLLILMFTSFMDLFFDKKYKKIAKIGYTLLGSIRYITVVVCILYIIVHFT